MTKEFSNAIFQHDENSLLVVEGKIVDLKVMMVDEGYGEDNQLEIDTLRKDKSHQEKMVY